LGGVMAWFTRFTRFADMHLVYGQEHSMSCGPSSIVMCIAKIKKLSAGQAIHSEGSVRALYSSLNRAPQEWVFPADGASGLGLANTLNSLACGTWVCSPFSSQLLIQKVGVHSALSGPIVAVEPVILGLIWSGGKGGHAVVVDTIRESGSTRYATVCDPYDANVHVQEFGTGLNYAAKPAQFWDGPGTAEHLSAQDGIIRADDRKHFEWPPAGLLGRASIIIHRL
jgi:hypothetical protein